MKLINIFEQLSYGELAQLAIAGADGSGILEKDYPAIVSHINLALTDLYSSFPLRTEEVIIQQYAHINTYYLRPEFAQTNTISPEPIKYIMDSEFEPFLDNVLKIESVQDEDGQELWLNDENQYWSVHTPTYESVQVPYPDDENAMLIKYRAEHPKLAIRDFDPEEVDVRLPTVLVNSLMLFIAARVHTVAPSLEGMNLGNTYMAKYEASKRQIETLNIFNKANPTNYKLRESGWA